MDAIPNTEHVHVSWNKGKLTGHKPPLKLKQIGFNRHLNGKL